MLILGVKAWTREVSHLLDDGERVLWNSRDWSVAESQNLLLKDDLCSYSQYTYNLVEGNMTKPHHQKPGKLCNISIYN